MIFPRSFETTIPALLLGEKKTARLIKIRTRILATLDHTIFFDIFIDFSSFSEA